MTDIAILKHLQQETADRALSELENLELKISYAKRRLGQGQIAKSYKFAADAGAIDVAIAEHATLTKLIEMEQKP
ncbi:hypothetical protein H6F86_21000 [Phormidium sp. FACHB-592]|uniref:Uncharacterized protein n=1 Tax=Stenomitos frigidus AS-A4 TaxID=2933935 RepID=A0ABV0KEP0_9CYAN|nr:hypothetical protein [Phormidium sp. FACHB-592]MBD2076313.1 hypothetical protein [Phormidium sp. FACHB-592]